MTVTMFLFNTFSFLLHSYKTICGSNKKFFINFNFINHGVIVTGPADTVGPPPSSVILAVVPKLKVYLFVVVTVILNPEEFS